MVPLSFWRLFCVVITEQRESRHVGIHGEPAWLFGAVHSFAELSLRPLARLISPGLGFGPRGALARITKAACGEVGCSA